MFDIAWTEMLILVLVTLVVVGPKDLPKVVRAVGGMIRKARGLASEFQQGLDQLAREAELEDIKEQTESIAEIDVKNEIKRRADPTTGFDLPSGPIETEPESTVREPRPDPEQSKEAGADLLQDSSAADSGEKDANKGRSS